MISPQCLLKKRDWVKILTLKSRPWFKYGVKKDYLWLATLKEHKQREMIIPARPFPVKLRITLSGNK